MIEIMEVLIAVYLGFCGLFIGSFLNVLIDRLPHGKNVLTDRSRCDSCHKVLTWRELIPILSFVLQKGRCRKCHTKLSLRYPISELATSLIFFGITLVTLPNLFLTITALIIASCLLVITVIDIEHYLIPDPLVVVLLLTTLVSIILTNTAQLPVHLLSSIGAFAFLWFIWFVTKGKGMGFGDVKFAAFLGLSLGFPRVIVGLYAAFLTGAIWGVIMIIVTKKKLKSRLPFGPFLILGYLFGLVGSEQILRLLFG